MRRNPDSLKQAIKAITERYNSKTYQLGGQYIKLKRRDLLDLLIYVDHLEYEIKELENAAGS